MLNVDCEFAHGWVERFEFGTLFAFRRYAGLRAWLLHPAMFLGPLLSERPFSFASQQVSPERKFDIDQNIAPCEQNAKLSLDEK